MADVDENAYAALGLAFEDAPSEATIKKVRRARDARDARRAGRRDARDSTISHSHSHSKRRLTTTTTTTRAQGMFNKWTSGKQDALRGSVSR